MVSKSGRVSLRVAGPRVEKYYYGKAWRRKHEEIK
jgi:hypothetical protein